MMRQTKENRKYFVGPDAKSVWEYFETAEQVRQWIAANAEWGRAVYDETVEAAEYQGCEIRVYKRTRLSDGSGEKFRGAWVLDNTIITTRRREPTTKTQPAPERTKTTYSVTDADGQAHTVQAEDRMSAVIETARQLGQEGVYELSGIKMRAVRNLGDWKVRFGG